MAPYREVEHEERAEAPRDPGIVGDVIAQFADPLAFFRELVQNAIDAGSPSVEIRLEHDGPAQVMRASVRDRGEGMTREIIEHQLLVLFRSTKERDDTKIGKFGIGFASVLAPQPRIVIVQTARDGRRLALHLHPDLTYQLFDAGPATQTGTVVELELPMRTEVAAEFVERSRAALVRWCRHATVPIQLEAAVPEAALALAVRIDRPLAIEGALVEVRGSADGGALVVAVGIVGAEARPYAGFFNHGLTLYETTEPLLGRLAVVIQDPRLGHTLSRDNVRRDDRFTRAIELARELAERQLPAAAARELQAAAAAADDRARYHTLAAAIDAAGVELRAEEWAFPLVEPIGDARWIAGSALRRTAWSAPRPGSLVSALDAAGVPVLHVPEAHAQAMRDRAQAFGCRLDAAADALTSVEAIEPTPDDLALLGELHALLDAVHRAPEQLVLARLAGACGDQLAVAGGPADAIHRAADPGAPFVIDRDTARRNPFALLRRPPLVLSVGHGIVAAARAHAEPQLAASHLARALLLHYRALDGDRSAAILTHTLARLGVA